MSIAPGDVVTFRGKPWAVIEVTRATPSGEPETLIGRDHETIRVATAGLEVITTATWQPGQHVRFPFHKRHGVVISIEGDHVLVSDERPRRYAGGDKFTRSFLTAIPKGRLAQANLNTIVQNLGA